MEIPPMVSYMIVITPISEMVDQRGILKATDKTIPLEYTTTPVANPRLSRNTALTRERAEGPNRCSRYSYTLISSSSLNRGIKKTITAIIASGRASSYCSQVKPPPSFKATNAGTDMKLIAEVWVAIVDRPMAHQEIFLPPT